MKSFIALLIFTAFTLTEFKDIYKNIFEIEVCYAVDLEDDEKQENEKKKIEDDKYLNHQNFHFVISKKLTLKNCTALSFLYTSTIRAINSPPPEL